MVRARSYLHASLPRLNGASALPVRDASGRPLIRMQTLGAAMILVGEIRLTAAAGTLFSLLVRLTGTPGMQVSRDVLRSALWPNQEEPRQRGNLRQALYKLRGYGVDVAMQGDVISMDAAQVVRTFSVERTAETFERDVTMGHEPFGPYLPGFVVPWPEFQAWLDEQREAVHADVRRILAEQLRRRKERADWGGADALARWLLQFDPLNEEATLTIAECTALSGSKHEALAIIDRFLAELGPCAGDLRLQATLLRRRIAEPAARNRLSFAATERHFIGREQELAELTMSMRRARWHDGSAVLLHGTPGIGKTRLAHELEKVATIEGVRVAQASCRESDLLRPMSVFLELVPDLLNRPGALGCSPESMAVLKRFLPKELDTSDEGRRQTTTTDHDEQDSSAQIASRSTEDSMREPMPIAATIRRAIVDLVAAVSDERPLYLTIEDVHWIDEHSWEVLSDLAEHADKMRLFLLLTSREAHARPVRPQRVPLSLTVRELPPLTDDNCFVLSRAIGEDFSASVSDELGKWFVDASAGIPLFLRALVNNWIESGEAGGVPPTLQGVIEQRLSQVGRDALAVLQTSALLGKWATVDRVASALQLSNDSMLAILGELESHAMLADAEGLALVCHELVANVAVSKLHTISRRLLHVAIAKALEEELVRTVNSPLLLQALAHWKLAGDEEAIVRTVISRLQWIERTSEPNQTLRLLESIGATTLDPSQIAEFESVRSRLRVEIGLYREELAIRSEGLALPQLGPETTDDCLERALSLVESTYHSDVSADVNALADFAILSVGLRQLSRVTQLRAASVGLVIVSNQCDAARAATLWRTLGTSDEELRDSIECTRVGLMFHTVFGDRDHAEYLARRLLLTCRQREHSLATPSDAIRAGFALRVSAPGRDHLDSFKLAFDTAMEIGLSVHGMNAAWQLAHCHLDLGETDAYERWTRELRALQAVVPDRVSTNFASALLCRGAIEQGDSKAAAELFSAFMADLPAHPTIKAASHKLALEVAIGLLTSEWIPTKAQLRNLQSYGEIVTRHGTADFFVSVLIEAVARTDARSAAGMLRRYDEELRRERGPWSARLMRAALRIEKGTH